jgi:hypothetical protein
VPTFPLELEAAVELADVLDEVDEVDDAEAALPPVALLLVVDPPDPLLLAVGMDPPDPPAEVVVEPPVLPTEAVDPPAPPALVAPLELLEVPPPRPFPDVVELLHPPGSVAKATTPRSALATPVRLTAALFIFQAPCTADAAR